MRDKSHKSFNQQKTKSERREETHAKNIAEQSDERQKKNKNKKKNN